MQQIFRTIIVAGILAAALCGLSSCLSEQNYITYEELKALLDDAVAMKAATIVDIRPAAAWKAGYIPEAINIEYDTVLDDFGGLKDGGSALTSIVTAQDSRLVIYGTGEDRASLFAAQALQLGYTDVKLYKGGMVDWRDNHGDYLYITYEGFRQWYDAACPFTDNENYLVDVHPPSLYTGYGHIPGAINIMSKHFADLDPGSLQPITDSITSKGAAIVFYCVGVS